MTLITFQEAKGNFFDRQKVTGILGREVAGAMAKVGAFIRTTAQRSIRPSRRWKFDEMPEEMQQIYEDFPKSEMPFVSSKPGEPPRARTRRLKRSIYFAFDPRTKSAVVGPIHFPGSRSDHAPSVLEFGGMSTVRIEEPKRKRRKGRPATEAQAAGLRKAIASGKLRKRKKRQPEKNVLEMEVRIEPRPYMQPALKKARPRIGLEFKNLVRGHIR